MDVIKNITEWAVTLTVTLGLTGGTGVLIYRHFFLDRKQRQDAQEKLIERLEKLAFDRIDNINALNTSLMDLRKDLDYWKREHNEVVKRNDILTHENQSLRAIKSEFDKLKKEHTDLKHKYDQLIRKTNLNTN